VVLVLRALKREGESVKRERCSSSRDDDGSRPILIGRERGSIGASAITSAAFAEREFFF